MAEQSDRLWELSQTLAERLRRDDEDALAGVLDHFGTYVRTRLLEGFGSLLREEDRDEIVAHALFRVWTYRHRYDPEKSSLATWFYLIARSVAKEHLRRRKLGTSASSVAVDATAPPPSELPASAELLCLERALAELPSEDRTILMTYAEHGDEGAWAAALAERWGVPASTIRSRKRRALTQLRHRLQHEGLLKKQD
jgi:RNA polymerase sigma-70 factor, ECF subfamily